MPYLLFQCPSSSELLCDGKIIYRISIKDNEILNIPLFQAEDASIVTFDSNNDLLAISLTNKQLIIYDNKTNSQVLTLVTDRKLSVVYFLDSNRVVCLQRDGIMNCLNIKEKAFNLTRFGRSVTMTAATRIGNDFVVADRDGVVARLFESFLVKQMIVDDFGYVSQLLNYQEKLIVLCENGVFVNDKQIATTNHVANGAIVDDKLFFLTEIGLVQQFDFGTEKLTEVFTMSVAPIQFKGMRLDLSAVRLVKIDSQIFLHDMNSNYLHNIALKEQQTQFTNEISSIESTTVNEILLTLKHNVGSLSNIVK